MPKWKLLTAVAVSLCLWTIVSVHAKAPALTALDYFEIQQLANRYGQAIDTCSNNGHDYADLFTADGMFVDKFTEEAFKKGGMVRAQGREKLAEVSGGGSRGCK